MPTEANTLVAGSEPETRWEKTAEGKWVPAGCPANAGASEEPLGVLHATHTEMHGFRGCHDWAAPKCVLRDGSLARTGYTSVNRDEFEDTPTVLAAKVKLLASMLKQAEVPIAYTGAGISTASGIPDYATGSSASRAALPTSSAHPLDASPTDAHVVLARLHAAGLMKAWVQQNHDGLPQKAGFPQASLNEIHGAWFDPSNPVVKMNGNLREDLFQSLLKLEETADCCLCVGTSLSGMNADRVAVTLGNKAMQHNMKHGTETVGAPGLVIVNLQRTQHDDVAALRIFAQASVVLKALAAELDLPSMSAVARNVAVETVISDTGCRFRIPYSPINGRRLPDQAGSRKPDAPPIGFEVNLQEGAVLRVALGPYEGEEATVRGRTRQGHFRLAVSRDMGPGKVKGQVPLYLGKWWLLDGLRGDAPYFPLVPLSPSEGGA